MIKDIKALTKDEADELKEMYTNYFEIIASKQKRSLLEKIFKKYSRDKSEIYADEMIYKSQSEPYLGYTYFDDNKVLQGFITGRYDYKDTAWISHMHVERQLGNPAYEKRIALELYKTIASEFKRLGCENVMTEVSENEYEYLDILYSLSFEQVHDYEDGNMDYGRKL